MDRNLYAEFSVYQMQINDLLVAQRVGNDQYVGVNAGETIHEGIEALINYYLKINSTFSIQPYVSASIGHYEFKEFLDNGTDYSGNELTGVPANKINAGFTLHTNFGVYLSSDYYFIDKIPLNDGNTAYSDAYRLLNLKACVSIYYNQRFFRTPFRRH